MLRENGTLVFSIKKILISFLWKFLKTGVYFHYD